MTALGAQAAEPEHVLGIRNQLDKVEKTIRNPAAGLASSDTTPLLEKKAAADEALDRYSRLLEQGQSYDSVMISLVAVNGGLVADDATGIGAADDVLLPFTGLALLVAAMTMTKPATVAQVNAAWQDLLRKLQALSLAATQAASRRTCNCLCYKRGVGPKHMENARNEASCLISCKDDGYSGYRCGKGDVTWFN